VKRKEYDLQKVNHHGEAFLAEAKVYLFSVIIRDALTHGPTGPGPRGPLKFLDLGAPSKISKNQ